MSYSLPNFGVNSRVKDFLDESDLEELPQLRSDRSASLFIKAPQLLLHDSGVR
jgi:hypothetical protein